MLSDSAKLFMAGLVMGWGPCLIHTAPLLLPYIGVTKRSWHGGLKLALEFSIGRFMAFVILGGLATVAFRLINQLFPPHKSGWLYLIIALFMLGMGILIILGKKLKIRIKNEIFEKGTQNMFIIGFIMGVAPCAPYIAILTYIAAEAEGAIFAGILYAAIFAIGTAVAPAVLGALMGIISGKLVRSEKLFKIFQVICGTILILFGLNLIYSVLSQII